MKILVSAVIAALAAQSALAEQADNRPFNTVNGRSTPAAPAARRILTVTTPGGGAAANTPTATATPAAALAAANVVLGGGGRQVAARGSSKRGVHRGGKSFWGGERKVDGGGATTAPAPGAEELPPNFTKPGALIRTTGQLPKYEKAEAGQTHTTDAGEIVMNKRKAVDVGRAPNVHHGPKDTLPPPNPVTGGTYVTGAAANSGPGAGSSSGKGGGRDNNIKETPGDDDDGHGGDKAMTTSFNDAF